MHQHAKIPFVDLRANSASIKQDVLDAISDVIDSSGYILGKEVALFEDEFAEYCGAEHAIGVANGTDALHMALRTLGIGPGDEVITVGNSFAATAFAIAYSGADAVLVDIRERDFNIDVGQIERAITPRSRAIIPVHLYGQCARMSEIMEIARRHGLAVIEDAAQAHGAELGGRRAGTFGDMACFSFYPGKNLGAFGDGGAVVTNNSDHADRLRLLRNYGQVRKNEHSMLGYNCRLDSIQAAVLLVKMRHIESWTENRRRAASLYRKYLGELDLILPLENDDSRHVYHLFVARHPRRDEIIQSLADDGISCGIHYPHPLQNAGPFRNARTVPEGLPVCAQVANEIFSLPMFPEITEEQIQRVADRLAVALSTVTV